MDPNQQGPEDECASFDRVKAFVAYPFDADEVYQQGLAGIVSGGALNDKSDTEKEDILRRSRLFYFNRCNITEEDIRRYQTFQSDIAVTPSLDVPETSKPPEQVEDTEPRTLTFAELKELIESGKTDQIPNNRVIPNDLNRDAPSESIAPVRRKPWEAVVENTTEAMS